MSTFPVLSCHQVREIDRIAIEDLQMPGAVLMENAGRGIVDLMRRQGVTGPILIACGPGNNGGDGYVIARHLDLLGLEVHVMLACAPERLSGEARDNFGWLASTDVRIHIPGHAWPSVLQASRFAWVVDALLGTGVHGKPRAPISDMILQLNRLPARRVAVDLPSGLDAESGLPTEATFRADFTGTFVAAKPGLIAATATPFVGRLEVIDIGIPRGILRRFGLLKGPR